MRYFIKTKNQMDKRRWVERETNNRLDVVKALGGPFSPLEAEKLAAHGEYRALRSDTQIKVVKC